MKQGVWGIVVMFVLVLVLPAHAGVIAQIDLKDGSRLLGEIIEMTEGSLKVKAAFHEGDPISILWSEVIGLTSEEPMTLVFEGWNYPEWKTQDGRARNRRDANHVVRTSASCGREFCAGSESSNEKSGSLHW